MKKSTSKKKRTALTAKKSAPAHKKKSAKSQRAGSSVASKGAAKPGKSSGSSKSSSAAKKTERIVFHKESAAEFYHELTDKSGFSYKEVHEFSRALFEEIEYLLNDNEKISLPGFGTFHVKNVESREGYNPQKRKKMTIQAHRRVSFKASSVLAERVNEKYRHLKPNVLDEMRNIAGLKSSADKYDIQDRKIARKRAWITLASLLLLVLLFLGSIIAIPVYFRGSHHRAVVFARELNEMLGMQDVSKGLEKISPDFNRERIREYMKKTAAILSEDREIVASHKVVPGESIYSIAKKYWGNEYLWPDLYYTNRSEFTDPDLILRGDTIVVYEKLGNPDDMSSSKRTRLVEAYITMYRVTRALGDEDIRKGRVRKGRERIRQSQWTLYTALRYDHDLLDTYDDAIYPEDAKMIREYIKRFGYGDESEQ